MDKSKRAAIARAYEVDRGYGGGESGAREGGEGEGGGGGGWLSGLSVAAPEVPTDVESGSADWGGFQAAARTSHRGETWAKMRGGGGETWGRVVESLIRASGISLGASGVGLVQLRHHEDLMVR
jgi:hypothetical protein